MYFLLHLRPLLDAIMVLKHPASPSGGPTVSCPQPYLAGYAMPLMQELLMLGTYSTLGENTGKRSSLFSRGNC